MPEPQEAEPPKPPEPTAAQLAPVQPAPVQHVAAPAALDPNDPDVPIEEFDRQLLAEISILVDFISSRGDKTLAAGPVGKLPAGFVTYADALREYFKIAARHQATRPREHRT